VLRCWPERIYIYIYIFIYIYICICICMYVCIYVCMYVCMYACMYTWCVRLTSQSVCKCARACLTWVLSRGHSERAGEPRLGVTPAVRRRRQPDQAPAALRDDEKRESTERILGCGWVDCGLAYSACVAMIREPVGFHGMPGEGALALHTCSRSAKRDGLPHSSTVSVDRSG
jgi:hypothetical protein